MRIVILMPTIVHVSDNDATLGSEVVDAAARVRSALNQQGFPTLARAPQVFAEGDADHAKLRAAIADKEEVTLLGA